MSPLICPFKVSLLFYAQPALTLKILLPVHTMVCLRESQNRRRLFSGTTTLVDFSKRDGVSLLRGTN